MADQQKGKNRAAILQELESIKGLLVDEEDIPVLQEVIDTTEAQLENGETLDEEDLQELQRAYRDLLQAHEDTEAGEAPAVPTPELESPFSDTAARTEVQTSLFDTDFSQPEDLADSPSEDSPQEAPEPEPQAGKPASSENRGSSFRRSGVTKATGENPFLPAHIRARLHGNRPPPLFEPLPFQPISSKAASKEALKGSEPGQKLKRAQLTDELVAEFLPQIEVALRTRLKAMTEEQLQQLASEDTGSHEDDGDQND